MPDLFLPTNFYFSRSKASFCFTLYEIVSFHGSTLQMNNSQLIHPIFIGADGDSHFNNSTRDCFANHSKIRNLKDFHLCVCAAQMHIFNFLGGEGV